MFVDNNECYKNVSYWNDRYSTEDTKDWLLSYDALKEILSGYIKPEQSILMLGCGNSLLSEQLALAGFLKITNIDYSAVVISKMQKHCDVCSKLKWMEMDARNLLFDDQKFDIVLEKATIDSFLVDEKNAWTISQKNSTLLKDVLSEVSRILKPGGHFLSLSFSQPHFRGPLYAQKHFQWSFETVELGQHFHYYMYIMTKGKELNSNSYFSYIPPTTFIRENNEHIPDTECDLDFLKNIEL